MNTAFVLSVNKSPSHTLVKKPCSSVEVMQGLGINGDTHAGKTVKHRYDVAKTPNKPNFRQIHLIHFELYQELNQKGFMVSPGEMGENITTKNIDLLNLPKDTILKVGDHCVLQVTGLRQPCSQLNRLQKGLKQAVLDLDSNGDQILKAGIFAVVLQGGIVMQNDCILIELPQKPFVALQKV